MKKIILAVAIFAAFTACNEHSDEEYNSTNNARISAENLTKEQAEDLIQKDSMINNFLSSFNEIQGNLDEIKEKEKIVSINTKDPENQKSQPDQIISDINAIKELMQKNKDRLASLQGRLKDAKFKNEALQKLVERLTLQIEEKDKQIASLQEQLSNSNAAFKDLMTQYDTKSKSLDETSSNLSATTTKLNTAYYAYGTKKELKKNGVVTKEGGFIGLGKSTTLSNDFNKSYFTKIDIKEVKEIKLNVKKAKILTNHPSSSYKLVTKDKMVETLFITSEEDFWSNSKYLVIETE